MTTPENGGAAGRLLLRSVRIDNYKCLGGFELPFEAMTLLLGRNGCGKTAVFDAVNALHRFVSHSAQVAELFSPSTLTRWGDSKDQSFELRAGGENGDGEFCYHLIVEHELAIRKSRVKRESLTLDDKPLFEFVNGEMQLYRDNHSPGPKFPYDWHVSGMAHIPERGDNQYLSQFRKWLDGVTLLALAPDKMRGGSDEEAQHLSADGGNFASWYRSMVQEDHTVMASADEALARVLPGYQKLKLVKAGGEAYRELRAVFKSENGAQQDYAFDELSSGQRVLIALYCFLHGGDRNRLLLLDEPDNFVTLPEVQPLLSELEMDAGDELPQVAMISHHPEAVDFISDKEKVWLDRKPEQPARVVEFENDTKLHTSKLYARGLAP